MVLIQLGISYGAAMDRQGALPRAQKMKKWGCWGVVGPLWAQTQKISSLGLGAFAILGPTAPQHTHFSFFGPGGNVP